MFERKLGIPTNVHADLDERNRNARILTNRPMAFSRHPRIDEDLRNRVLGGGRLLFQIRLVQRLDVIDRMVVADELERVGDGRDEIFLFDGGHVGIRLLFGFGARFQCSFLTACGMMRSHAAIAIAESKKAI